MKYYLIFNMYSNEHPLKIYSLLWCVFDIVLQGIMTYWTDTFPHASGMVHLMPYHRQFVQRLSIK